MGQGSPDQPLCYLVILGLIFNHPPQTNVVHVNTIHTHMYKQILHVAAYSKVTYSLVSVTRFSFTPLLYIYIYIYTSGGIYICLPLSPSYIRAIFVFKGQGGSDFLYWGEKPHNPTKVGTRKENGCRANVQQKLYVGACTTTGSLVSWCHPAYMV